MASNYASMPFKSKWKVFDGCVANKIVQNYIKQLFYNMFTYATKLIYIYNYTRFSE